MIWALDEALLTNDWGIVRLTSTPFHLERTTDHNLGCWQRDMDTWVEELPQHFAVSTKLKLPQANDLFNLLVVAVEASVVYCS